MNKNTKPTGRVKVKVKVKPKYPPLERVDGSYMCQFSVVENKLAALYRNQQKIYVLLIKLADRA